MFTTMTAKFPAGIDWPATLALASVAGVYLWLAFGVLPPGGYWMPDTGVKRIQAANVRFNPAPDLTIDYPGQWLDPDFKFLPFAHNFYFIWQGRVHFSQPFYVAFMGRPFIRLMGDYGERVVPLLAGLVSVYLTGRLAQILGVRPVWPSVLLAGFATPLIFYSLSFWEHTLAAALGLGALALVLRPAGAPPWPLRVYLVSGLLAGLGGVVRKEIMFFALALGVVLALNAVREAAPYRRRASSGLAAWSSACVCVFVVYLLASYLNSGHPVPPEFRIAAPPSFTPRAYLLVHGWTGLADFLFDPRFGRAGTWLMITVGVYWLAGLWPRPAALRTAMQVGALAVLCLGVGSFMWGQSASPYLRGVFSASPWLVLGLRPQAGERRLARDLSLTALGFLGLAILSLGLLTTAGAGHGGGEWGARFFLTVFPLGAPLAASSLQTIWERAAQGWLARLRLALALALVGLSLAIQGLGLIGLRAGFASSLELRWAILALPETQVVTNQVWLASRVPKVYLSKEVSRLDAREDWVAWVQAADARGVRRFAFVSSGLPDEAVLAAAAPPGTQIKVIETRRLDEGFFATRLEITPSP